MWSGFRTILKSLKLRPVSNPRPVRVQTGLVLTVPGEKLVIGTENAETILVLRIILNEISSIDERLLQVDMQRLGETTFVPDYSGAVLGDRVFVRWEVTG